MAVTKTMVLLLCLLVGILAGILAREYLSGVYNHVFHSLIWATFITLTLYKFNQSRK